MATYSAPLTRAEEREFVPFMHELIGIAFATIRGYFMTGTAVVTKGDASPVTMADRNAEEAMRRLIERRYPRHAIMGEEHGNKPGERYRWVLDPIDGTRAFITNCFLFGTLIALERDDGEGFRPVLGVIGHPAAGVALIGHAGASTLYASDGSSRATRVRPCARLADATVLATTHWSTGEQRGGARRRTDHPRREAVPDLGRLLRLLRPRNGGRRPDAGPHAGVLGRRGDRAGRRGRRRRGHMPGTAAIPSPSSR